MSSAADVCLVIEGSYPYVLGGVSSWTDALIRALPHRSFHIVALSVATQERTPKYVLPDNVVGLTDVMLDYCTAGRWFVGGRGSAIDTTISQIQSVLMSGNVDEFVALVHALENERLGRRSLLDSPRAWKAMERIYNRILPDAPLLDFFWAWRVLARSILAIATTSIPEARVYHAISTGYAGLFGACAKCVTRSPLMITEHGIYTNERRIEICAAEWIHESGAGGFDVLARVPELRDLWSVAFASFSRIAYSLADSITTLYRGNQVFQIKDGAPEQKLLIIPNGIDIDRFAQIDTASGTRRPCVILIGRIVPIKDIRTFVLAIGILTRFVPDIEAIIVGPEDEDSGYAAECKLLAQQLGLRENVRFVGAAKDVRQYLRKADLNVLTSISEAQPLSLLEAGAAGLPSVATDVGACREILEGDPGTAAIEAGGIVVPTCDPQATAKAIAKILLDPALRRQMGEIMRKRVESLYNKPCSIRMYDQLYASLLESGECTLTTRI
jgi:glycosyltransferase involved in cell wall biosynthesis